jgi:hypothetical protein
MQHFQSYLQDLFKPLSNNIFVKKIKIICPVFLLLALVFGLSSCQKKLQNEEEHVVRGAYFGSSDGQEVLLTNKDGSVQRLDIIKNSEYKINLLDNDLKKGPFKLIYSYDQKPSINPEPPYIIANIEIEKSLLLPAILVFDMNLKVDSDRTDKEIPFRWARPVFSDGNSSSIYLETLIKDGFPLSHKKRVLVSKIPFESTEEIVDLNVKIKKSGQSLSDCVKRNCADSVWYLRLPYRYPEGINLVYASNQVKLNLCK